MPEGLNQNGDSPQLRLQKLEREMLAGFVERSGADCVVVVYSQVKRNRTSSRIAAWGNSHAAAGLTEWAADQLAGIDDPELEEDEDDEDDEEEEDAEPPSGDRDE